MGKYFTEYNSSEIKDIILPNIKGLINNPTQILNYPKFKGEITETKIDIESIESSPTFIRGSIRPLFDNSKYKSEVIISVDSVDFEKGPVMIILVFSYIFIAIVFSLSVIKNPMNIWTYIITLISCFIPLLIMKIYSFFESTPPTPEIVKRKFLERINAVKI